jgi:hypothetical protein
VYAKYDSASSIGGGDLDTVFTHLSVITIPHDVSEHQVGELCVDCKVGVVSYPASDLPIFTPRFPFLPPLHADRPTQTPHHSTLTHPTQTTQTHHHHHIIHIITTTRLPV